jgi:predicted nucleic acid-binding protein
MDKALLDTDALSEILKGKNQSITKKSTRNFQASCGS